MRRRRRRRRGGLPPLLSPRARPPPTRWSCRCSEMTERRTGSPSTGSSSGRDRDRQKGVRARAAREPSLSGVEGKFRARRWERGGGERWSAEGEGQRVAGDAVCLGLRRLCKSGIETVSEASKPQGARARTSQSVLGRRQPSSLPNSPHRSHLQAHVVSDSRHSVPWRAESAASGASRPQHASLRCFSAP
jgi:hypothetical protein